MPKNSRGSSLIGCAILLLVVSYWISIISSICGESVIFIIASIVYTISYITVFELQVYGRRARWKKRLKRLILIEAVQLMPCIILWILF